MGKPNAAGIVTGAVVGLVAITPASGFVGPVDAIIIGALATMVSYTAMYLKNKHFKVDDSLDVFACHGLGGTVRCTGYRAFRIQADKPGRATACSLGMPSQLE